MILFCLFVLYMKYFKEARHIKQIQVELRGLKKRTAVLLTFLLSLLLFLLPAQFLRLAMAPAFITPFLFISCLRDVGKKT